MTISPFSIFNRNDFAGTGRIIAAVSGGSDSLAMLFLLHDYLTRIGCRERLAAVTVDHALRAASAQEARGVAQLCAQYGIPHKTLVWRAEKPASAVSFQARLARYDLLCQAAQTYGAGVIVTGHTLDDQAETYAMRALRAGGRGLAAMPRLALLQRRFRLLRPVLDMRRRDLRSYLVERGIAWVDDPSNDNPRFERARVRQRLDDRTVMRLSDAVSAAARQRRAMSEDVASLAVKLRMCLRGERLWLDLAALAGGDAPALAVLAAMGAAIMGGAQYPAAGRPELRDFLMRQSAAPRRMTLSGAVIEMSAKFLRIWRERRNLASYALKPGQTVVWDGRYRVSNGGDETVVLRPPARAELRQFIKHALPQERHTQDLHVPSLETACLVCSAKGLDLPVLTARLSCNSGIGIERIMLPFDWLLSSHDLAMFQVFQRVFTMRAGKMIKTGGNYHDSEQRTLATLESEHMLHKNSSGAPAPLG